MARQKGIITIEGTLGDVNFYIRKGEALARKAGGGFNADAIRNKPSMVRTRENASEFGNCSRVKKMLRLSIWSFFGNVIDASFHGRMMQLMQEIKVLDSESIRGKREVKLGLSTPLGKKLFKEFAFTPARSVVGTLNAICKFNLATYRFEVTSFDIKQVNFPKQATHFKLFFCLVTYDFENYSYSVSAAEPLLFNRKTVLTSFTMTTSPLPDTTEFFVGYIGIAFYQEVGGTLYALKEQGMIGVECVWV